jgi:hypothetical protein
VKYKALTESAFKEKLAGFDSPVLAQHFEEATKDHTNGLAAGTNHIIEEVTGKPPMGVAEFIKKNQRAFEI